MSNNWNEESLRALVATSNTYSEVLSTLGYKAYSGNYRTLKRYIEKYSLDISHFTGRSTRKHSYTPEEVFCENSKYSKSGLRTYVISKQAIVYACSNCGIGPEWNGKPLVLELEHINGVSNDNRIENLTFLCPNCHSQTTTFRGRNVSRSLRVCKNCKINPPETKNSKYCSSECRSTAYKNRQTT